MKSLRSFLTAHRQIILFWTVGLLISLALLLFHLGSLTKGVSTIEASVAVAPIGWHGLYNQPLYLPMQLLRSVIYTVFNHHGNTITRLSSAVVGALAITSFAWSMRRWYGRRNGLFAAVLFGCASWTLHVSRYANFDVLYLAALPLLCLVQLGLKQTTKRRPLYYAIITWSLLVYVPGLVWLVGLQLFWQRREVIALWKLHTKLWQKVLVGLGSLAWLPLLLIDFIRRSSDLVTWLGLPHHVVNASKLAIQLLAVPGHLFIHGPGKPALWLGKSPILDVFVLVTCLIGLYFYITHIKAARSRWLLSFLVLGGLLVGLGGPVSLSLLVPEMYIFAGAGVGYLLHDWLKIFPRNPIARGIGIGLISLAVAASCVYNLRAYFVAWPHDPTTRAVFTRNLLQ